MSRPAPTDTDPRPDTDAGRAAAVADWVVVRPAGARRPGRLPRLRTVLLQVGAAAVVVIAAVAVVGLLVSRRAAESESVRDAAELTNVLADTAVQPALTDPMATSTTAAAGIAPVVRAQLLSRAAIVRVKLWSPQGRILWSDEPRLVGQRFELEGDAREALTDQQVSADISDLDEPENRYERGRGTLLEVHRAVWTPAGHPLLLETYFRYDQVADRAHSIWRGFAGITLGSIGALVLLLVPLGWTLLSRARRAQQQREDMLRRAMDASLDERRRIAATLHDGVVQDLVAASFAIAAGAQDADARGNDTLGGQLRDARDTVRSSIGGMRSLLVDIYPPNLHDAGLPAALRDLVTGLRLDAELVVDVAIDEAACDRLDPAGTEAVFRTAQEALRNVATHARATRVDVSVHREQEGSGDGDGADGAGFVVLEVADDGTGFDPATRPAGHFGLSLMDDVAREQGGELALRTAPGAGTAWRLRLPAQRRAVVPAGSA
ncbi:Histidine kinase-, DNA gyrase B-, and HSP90-like ATPase [Jatrophihabitans endophyticus]|uniref:Oxygen sensor histidine kinase NreB n=1 Tax=Jatrophihabitans endophyticus TaxID=1206085 RepID=A0A1M5MYE4_9ACTN|nr:histidine kinase [Jatrophihabitans endophyticus]SHG82301.1 Histidine kinase-, DNA gyrase B-, and HSP90-like ATPase [Jatrophihabitans endophyticus]